MFSDIPGVLGFGISMAPAGDGSMSSMMDQINAMTARMNTPGSPEHTAIQAQVKLLHHTADKADPTEEEAASPFWKSIMQDDPDGRLVKPEQVRSIVKRIVYMLLQLT